MKISILKTLVITITLLLSKNVYCQYSEFELTESISADNLFKAKNLVTENNSIDFLKQFYAISIVEGISQNDNLKLAVQDIVKNKFSCVDLNSKKVLNFIKKCKTKKELLNEIEKNIYENFSFFDEDLEEGIRNYHVIKLTNEAYVLYSRACGSGGGDLEHHLLLNLNPKDEDTSFFQGDMFLNGIMYSAKYKLEKKLKIKLNEVWTVGLPYGTTKINNQDFITMAYDTNKDSQSLLSYNLIIAFNFKTNEYYYLYDSNSTKDDDWKNDSEVLMEGSAWVTEKNANWKIIQ